ncbi:hypothetical protein [Tritonibacter mobilis]|uniref:hypothetical protein n=1 Tax=Tritonibacter mobilis TaxID=379347 RepID=UPI000806A877|nr:hypothetical protein [Tritonibacter mobilis]
MKITCIPVAGLPGQSDTSASVNGDVITVNGTAYDLSTIPEGGFADPVGSSHPFVGRIERTNGEIHLQMVWRYSTVTAQPDQPAELAVVTISSGAVPDPIQRKPVEAKEYEDAQQ